MILSLLAAATFAAPADPAPRWPAALAAGDCTEVVRLLPSPESPIERLAAGRCLERLDQDGRALEVLGAFDGPLAPYAALVRARASLDRGDPAVAVQALAGVSLAGPEDDLLRGRALVLAGKGLDARDGLRALVETRVGDEARWWLAEGARMRGDTPAAIATWRAIWTRHPTSAWSGRAEQALAAAGASAPSYGDEASRALALERAATLLALKQANLAVPLLDGVHTAAAFTTQAQLLYMADALFDAKLYPRAVDWFARAGASTLSARAAFDEALATARSGDYPGAATRYDALIERYPGTSQADEALFKLPYMDYDAGRFEEARGGFRAYLDARPDGKFARDARWFRAWAAWRRGDTPQALVGFDEVLKYDGGTEQATAARYWKARATNDATALRAVLRDDPDSGYAWFAATRLGVTFPRPAAAERPAFPAAFLTSHPTVETGLLLAQAGLPEWARPLLSGATADAASGGAATAIPMAWALIDAEDYPGARKLASKYCATGPAAAAACLPRPHAGTVEAIAMERGLDPLLPYAIMNAESGLDPSVTSPAGARGLMQLMPALAVQLAKDALPGFAPDDLYRAGVNARLGTLELSLLQARFGRAGTQPSLPLVIAGYNGGGDPVERWLGGYTTPPEPDRFAEDISFTETRRYVRRVLGFLMAYRRAYGDP
ncbi:MAG: transglycosylase SLT domain-containing protein [Pseudomonadota bacterium]|nr:transglycosylase SLT domain-containing protein [Pseudomonadota bacterium]